MSRANRRVSERVAWFAAFWYEVPLLGARVRGWSDVRSLRLASDARAGPGSFCAIIAFLLQTKKTTLSLAFPALGACSEADVSLRDYNNRSYANAAAI
jgi:hypothetical protein